MGLEFGGVSGNPFFIKKEKMKTNFKVLLMATPWEVSEETEEFIDCPMPIGLAYIAGVLREKKINVKIFDPLAEGFENRRSFLKGNLKVIRVGLEEKKIKKFIEEYRPDLVGISNFFTSQANNMFRMAALVKEVDRHIPVAVGGVHPSADPEECLKDFNTDFVICGEGEYIFLGLAKAIENKMPIKAVKGIFYKEDGEIKNSGKPEIIMNLDEIPMPAYDLLPMDKYLGVSETIRTNRGAGGEKWMPIISSRGCPFRCIFCGANLLVGRLWRARSPKKFVDEMEYLVKNYQVRNFRIEDSNFTYNIERAKQICQEILDRGLKIKWSLPNGIRADRITRELVLLMKKSGCWTLSLGVEHGDQEYLNNFIGKNLDLGKTLEAAKIISGAGVPSSAFFMIGFPGEKKEHMLKTADLAIKMAKAGVMPLISIVIPLPGTKVMEICKQEKLLAKENMDSLDFLLVHHSRPIIMNPQVSNKELLDLRRRTRIKAALMLFLYHPILFFKYPFLVNLFKSFKDFRSIVEGIKLVYSKFNLFSYRAQDVPYIDSDRYK